jgi:hypothetical protein
VAGLHGKSYPEEGGSMIIKWYNRDEFSDQDMRRAKAVSIRLQGKKKESPDGITLELLQEAYSKAKFPSLLPYQMVVSPSQYQVLKKHNPFGWEPAPQWAKDAKDDDLRREEQK